LAEDILGKEKQIALMRKKEAETRETERSHHHWFVKGHIGETSHHFTWISTTMFKAPLWPSAILSAALT
jgi:hypothetical protein